MPQPSKEDKIDAINIELKLIKNYGIQYTSHVSEGVRLALNNRYAKLERERERLLNPPTPKARKPKAIDTSEPESMVTVKIERWGRDGRDKS